MIRYLAPWWLLAVLPVLALAGLYVWAQLRRRATAVKFSNVDLLRRIAPKGLGWRRHAAATAFLLCLLILSVGMARPAVDVQEPMERATVILAIDVSLSMDAKDVEPDRFTAAKAAAKDFVKQLPETFNVGLVAFSKSANVMVSPTKEHSRVRQSVDTLELGEGTATGEAVFASLQAIQSVPAGGAKEPPPARIVMLSDGFRTFGRSVEQAAEAASAANVPVSTIAFGTDSGTVDINGQTIPVKVDRASLERLATDTGGHAYEAYTTEELKQIYQDMGSSIGRRTAAREISQWFIGLAMLFGFAAAGMSLLWTSRIP
ncbi:MAG: VWA domain-containing protein [Micromonosporaceae bacterium]|nr:VWA domain-containing protein [Micromonosporaceae bacterium]